MKTAIIIDDEPLAREVIKSYLLNCKNIELLGEYGDGFEGYKAIKKLSPDLLFLDIQMPKITGFELLEMIDHPPKIIFTTAFDEYAIKAFEQNAIDYLLKPFNEERFLKAINKFLTDTMAAPQQVQESLSNVSDDLNKHPNRLVVKNNDEIKIIPLQQIIYFEANDDYVKIVLENEKFTKKKTLSFYTNQLERSDFVRVHRSYLLNLNFLTGIEPYQKDSYLAILKNGIKIPVSKTGYQKLKEKIAG